MLSACPCLSERVGCRVRERIEEVEGEDEDEGEGKGEGEVVGKGEIEG